MALEHALDGGETHPEPAPVQLVEEIDTSYVPTESEVLEAAEWLGIDVENDADFLWIAKKSMMEPLPHPWSPYQGSEPGAIFYFNPETGESSWDHPCDETYRQLYLSEKLRRAPVRVVAVSLATLADDGFRAVTCIGMSGDRLATLLCEEDQDFGGLKAVLSEELQLDKRLLRLVLPDSAIPSDDDIVASLLL